MKIFLDDERMPKDVTWVELPLGPWTIARSHEQFVELILENGLPTHVSFDHDLADEHYPCNNLSDYRRGVFDYAACTEKTGYHSAIWLVQYCLEKGLELPHITVHTMNVVGKKNILELIEKFDRFKEIYNKE